MKCFVIMPFSLRADDLTRYYNDPQHWVEVYKGLIVPAVRSAGCDPLRDDENVATRLIAQNVLRQIESADIVLCDLSSHNPNVHLELGWALRAEKKYVLIKDDLTDYSFDLNQVATFTYSHRLQPLAVTRAVDDLSGVIQATLKDEATEHSLPGRLRLEEQARQSAVGGNLEARLLNDLVAEVRALSEVSRLGVLTAPPALQSVEIGSPEQLAAFLPGTTWRKKSALEHLIFDFEGRCFNNHAGHPSWRENRYRLTGQKDVALIEWSVDGFQSSCRFAPRYDRFTEEENPEGLWYLAALRPHTPAWGI